jgi:hypothetical protein
LSSRLKLLLDLCLLGWTLAIMLVPQYIAIQFLIQVVIL